MGLKGISYTYFCALNPDKLKLAIAKKIEAIYSLYPHRLEVNLKKKIKKECDCILESKSTFVYYVAMIVLDVIL